MPAVSAGERGADAAPDTLLDAADRAACAVVADLLDTARLWSAPALGGLAAGGWAVTQASAWPLPLRVAALLALGLLLGMERYLAIRVALDARLLNRLALGSLESLAALDGALADQLGLPPAKAGRPLTPRLDGAQRLYRLHAGAALLCLAQVGWLLA